MPALKAAIPGWLDQWKFTQFVTLATNDATLADRRLPGSKLQFAFLRDRLRQWDARINRQLLGPAWSISPDRMFAFWFLEKANSNPHWHGLIRFFRGDDLREITLQEQIVASRAEVVWKKLVPSGSVKVQPVVSQVGMAKYVAKELASELSYSYFVTPDEFERG